MVLSCLTECLHFLLRALGWSFLTFVNVYAIFWWFRNPQADEVVMKQFAEGVKVGGHRGGAIDAPENTLAAFKRAHQYGADSVEFDLEFTSDGVPVILHDDTVDRTTDGRGKISDMTYAEARKLNAAHKFPNKDEFGFQPIPHLHEVIEECLKLNLKMFFDVKATNERVVPVLLETFQKYPKLYETSVVWSFYPQVVYKVKRADNRILVGHVWRPGFFAFVDGNLTQRRFENFFLHSLAVMLDLVNEFLLNSALLHKFTGANVIATEHRVISANYVKKCQQQGLWLVSWTVNDLQEKNFFYQNLNCPFLTDKLSDMQIHNKH